MHENNINYTGTGGRQVVPFLFPELEDNAQGVKASTVPVYSESGAGYWLSGNLRADDTEGQEKAPKMKMRDYQRQSIANICEEWEKVGKTLLVLPTGCGKTIVASNLAKKQITEGKRVLFLAHRGELLTQAADKMLKATGIASAREQAEESCLKGPARWCRFVVGSVQTLMRTKRLEGFAPDHFDCIIIDEAHHATSASYRVILDHFHEAKVVGLTATPDRADRQNLGSVFESIAFEYTIQEAIKKGYLVPIKAQTIPLRLDVSGCSGSGDLPAGEVGTALDPYLDGIAEALKEFAQNRKTVVFLPLIATSQKFTALLRNRGFDAREVNGESEDRAEVLQWFDSAGAGSVLCNSMLLTEGWDCPSVDCVVVLRPTKSRALYSQMVGRGTRPSKETGKTDLLLLDFLWLTGKHELCRPAHLICSSGEVAEVMTETLEEKAGGEPTDIMEAAEQAATDYQIKREETLAERLKALRKKKGTLVDPLQYAMSIMDQDLSSYVPDIGYESTPVTEDHIKQMELLGIDGGQVAHAGTADKVIQAAKERKRKGLASAKQIRNLERRGYRHVGQWTFQQAQYLFNRLACNRWRPLRDHNPATYNPERDQY